MGVFRGFCGECFVCSRDRLSDMGEQEKVTYELWQKTPCNSLFHLVFTL